MTRLDSPRRPAPVDGLVVAVLLLAGLGGTASAGANQPLATSPGAAAYALVVLAALPMLAWRAAPLVVFAANAVFTATYLALGYPFGPILLSGAFAVGVLAARLRLRLLVVAAALELPLVWLFAGAFGRQVAGLTPLVVLTVAWWVVPAAIGLTWRARREASARVHAEQARRAVSEERLRMAQEVHDVVGHGLAVIAMQAGVALHVLDRNPERVREALEAIRSTSREALDGLRTELDVLRGNEPASRRPRAGLDDVPGLVERVRAGGLPVTLSADLPPEALADDVGLAAYRIVQEALTNVLRHAGPDASASVILRRDGTDLTVEVVDTGARAAAVSAGSNAGPGTGIQGMRERARAVGGHLEAGPREGGGFHVAARLPLIPAARRAAVTG